MKQGLPGGDLEYAVVLAILEMGPATAKSVHERIGIPAHLVYTTIAKVLDRLCAKNLVSRTRQGRAFVYRARIDRGDLERGRAREAISALLGSEPKPALASLVDAVALHDPELLDELARVVAAKRRSRK